MSARIGLVIPYFGWLPSWFPYFVKSIAASPILEVLLFTDADVNISVPPNLKVIPFSLIEFNALASEELAIPISLAYPYKLCDLKPAFGVIFSRYLTDYEFWAFGDIDLVFGDLHHFLTSLLQDYDVMSFRRGWISGSLCILRNCHSVNAIFKRSTDWEKVCTSVPYEWFDEMGGFFYQQVLQGVDVLSLKGDVDSFTHVVKRAAREGELRCFFEDLVCEHLDWGETLLFDRGRLARLGKQEAVMYVHYVTMRRRFFRVPMPTAVHDHFYIRKTGIYAERPTLVSVCTREASRVVRGGIAGLLRLLGRYLGQNPSIRES